MKPLLPILFILLLSQLLFGQEILPGEYDWGLKLAVDAKSQRLTGYFEDYSGFEEGDAHPKFSCVFYIEGVVSGNKCKIITYYPGDKKEGRIEGTLEVLGNYSIAIRLAEEHGGCWNVRHFAGETGTFELKKQTNWMQISFVEKNKAYFYKDKNIGSKQKTYVVKSDFVCIEKIEGEWGYCTYFGEKITKGWMLIKDLNEI